MRRIESRFSVQRRQLKVWFVRAKKVKNKGSISTLGQGKGKDGMTWRVGEGGGVKGAGDTRAYITTESDVEQLHDPRIRYLQTCRRYISTTRRSILTVIPFEMTQSCVPCGLCQMEISRKRQI